MSKILELQPGDRILISRTDRLGDLVLALPVVETIKARYPECRVDVISSLYASPILENNDKISGILRVQNDQLLTSKPYKKELLMKVKKGDYKVVVVLYPERQISRLFYQAEIPHRLGTAGRFHSVFFNHRLLHSRKANRKHESEYNLDFLRFFRKGPTIKTPTVYPTDKELRNARRILGEVNINAPFIVLHPGSGGSADRWPVDKFIDLYAMLDAENLQVVLSGSDNEGEMIEEVAARNGVSVRKITGETDLRTLAAVLSLASVVVANSTGPLHLAVAVGTRVVGLYPGRQIMSPVRWGPVGKGHKVLQPPMPPLNGGGERVDNMDQIPAQTVARAVREAFAASVRQK
ncbi:MAG: glycosyltransferase family 9 protein [candidate division Zixibacteria bacterium]|jgi:ADP-heptose:LPS heptosyltransferase|nr:glycosyltransferase family 9 protein [candidate division Zixibacteria bacterium]